MPEIYVPTLNIAEAVCRFRAAGISTTEPTLGAGIEQGLYPFAICIKTTKVDKKTKVVKHGRRFEIYERLLDEYLAERAIDLPNNSNKKSAGS
jgi:hypothetical protein